MRYADVVGSWRLVSVTAPRPDGTERTPYGPHPSGMLHYTPDGWMSGLIVADRAGVDPVAYTGRASVDGDEMVHEVLVGLDPQGPGTVQRRQARFDGPDRLRLTASSPILAHLTWERVTN